jgi:uncharacterized protein DUF2330
MSTARMIRLGKFMAPMVMALGLLLTQAGSAFACGGLVAPDGDVRLSRATTMVAWHDGVERYLTAFSYQGSEPNVGWIVPLPAVPDKIEAGGRWTLQRLFRETHPVVAFDAPFAGAASTAGVQVLQQVQVEALNVTVLRGSGQAVLDWCASNGFALSADTRAHLLIYAQGSPIFMAAKYDTAAAQARHQIEGDGVPLLITMRIPHIWVPLEVLALDGQQVHADLYLLTDGPVNTTDARAVMGQSSVGSTIPGAPGFVVAFQERMNATLYHDLSSDRNMGWVRPDGWLTYLTLDAPDESVTYDLGVTPGGVIRLARFGTAPMAVVDGMAQRTLWGSLPHLPLGTPELALLLLVLLAAGAGVVAILWWVTRAAPKG